MGQAGGRAVWEKAKLYEEQVRAGWEEWIFNVYSDEFPLVGDAWAITGRRRIDGMAFGKIFDPSQMDDEFALDEYPGCTLEEVQKALEVQLILLGIV